MIRPSMRRLLSSAAIVPVLSALLLPTSAAADGPPRTSAERFYAGEPYTGMFADPSVLRANDRFYAVATNHDGLNLPLMTSEDLSTWTPREPLADAVALRGWAGYNDAMPTRPAWTAPSRGGRENQFSQWAPAFGRVGDRFLMAYSAAVTHESATAPRRSCIGLAVADTAEGPYVPTSAEPTVCFEDSPRGAIDPDIHVRPDGDAFLLWKQEGVPDVSEPALMSQRLSQDGTRLKHGSSPRPLLELVRGTWKGGVIENPSMVRKDGRTFLFYSGHDWHSEAYATGYAECETPLGPCVDKTHNAPLLASDGVTMGPGGADAFTDRVGRIRLAYAAWDAGRVGAVGTNARMLHVGMLGLGPRGRLRVVERG